MPVPLKDILAALPPKRRQTIERGAAQIVVANRSLRELRKDLRITQAELAEALNTSQANVAKIEGKADLMASTIVRIVEALGGTMRIVVDIPGRPTTTLSLGAKTNKAMAEARSVTEPARPPRLIG